MKKNIIYKSCRQGGVRYGNVIDSKGVPFNWEFKEHLYMRAIPIWQQMDVDGKLVTFKNTSGRDIFGNDNPLYIEIGMGNGEFIVHHAKNNPDQNWLGFEVFHVVFEKAISRVKRNFEEIPNNIRLVQFDAELFVRMMADDSVDGFYVNFPDPWPKLKHNKRRLLKSWFIDLMRTKLKIGACMTIVTDHKDYAEEISENLSEVKGLETTTGSLCTNDMGDYYKTKYFRKFAAESTVYFYQLKRVL